jgi:hypothetical protein
VDGTLDADLYVNGQPMAAIQEGRVAGDSLYFTIWGFSYFGERRGDSLSVEEIYGSRSMNWTMALHLASRDTASRL